MGLPPLDPRLQPLVGNPVSWGEWIAIWSSSLLATGLIVGWVFLMGAMLPTVAAVVLGFSVPMLALFAVGGWFLTR